MFGLFRRPSVEERARAEAIKPVVRGLLGLDDGVTVSVSEIQCGDASCPGTETVILVLQKGVRTRAYRVRLPLAECDDAAVTAAIEAGPSA